MSRRLAGARVVLVAIARAAWENANGLAFLAGAWALYRGIAGFSVPAAHVVAGAVLMAIGAYPYLQKRKRTP